MLHYPQIDPVALHLGPLAVHWYGLMYLAGIGLGWWLLHWRSRDPDYGFTHNEVSDLIFYAALGVVIGGRIGYVLFYDTAVIWQSPLSIFKIWQGGMSFHGGFLGVLAGCYLFSRKYHKAFMAVMDFVAPVVPIGLALGRLGNFINGELQRLKYGTNKLPPDIPNKIHNVPIIALTIFNCRPSGNVLLSVCSLGKAIRQATINTKKPKKTCSTALGICLAMNVPIQAPSTNPANILRTTNHCTLP